MAQIPDLNPTSILGDADEVMLKKVGGEDFRLNGSDLVSSRQPTTLEIYNGVAEDKIITPKTLNERIAMGGQGEDLLQNSHFYQGSPDSGVLPPPIGGGDYTAGEQVFLGWFVSAGGITDLSRDPVTGLINSTTGSIYQDIPKSGSIGEYTGPLVASWGDNNGKPTEDGAIISIDATPTDYYRVTLTPNGCFSAKMEQGVVASRHQALNLFDIYGHPDVTGVLNAKAFGILGGGNDDTDNIEVMFSSLLSNQTIDLNGLTISVVHKGVNENKLRPAQDLNQTTYALVEKKDNIKITNGTIKCSLDMTSNSLVLTAFTGCKGVEFDNVGLDIQASGIPLYSVNLLETFASLISFKHHYDGTEGKGLTIHRNCRLRVNHPDGGSIGPKDGNPVHDYSGKLVGVDFYGNVDEPGVPNPNQLIYGLRINNCEFIECTARTIWIWGGVNYRVRDNEFIDCGTASGKTEFLVRCLNWGVDGIVAGNRIVGGHFAVTAILISSNNSSRQPKDVSVFNNHFQDTNGVGIVLHGGVNISSDKNKFSGCTSDAQLIALISSAGLPWNNVSVKDNEFYDVTVETTPIYCGANVPYAVDIDRNIMKNVIRNTPGTPVYGVQLKFQPQRISRNKISSVDGFGTYLEGSFPDLPLILENEIRETTSNACAGFAAAMAQYKGNKINDCEKGILSTNGSTVEDNTIKGCVSESIKMLGVAQLINNTITATANTANGTDAIVFDSGGSPVRHIINQNTFISDGSWDHAFDTTFNFMTVTRNLFSGTYGGSEYVIGGGAFASGNTSDTADI